MLVISRATYETPITRPVWSFTGEMVTETSRGRQCPCRTRIGFEVIDTLPAAKLLQDLGLFIQAVGWGKELRFELLTISFSV